MWIKKLFRILVDFVNAMLITVWKMYLYFLKSLAKSRTNLLTLSHISYM